jgi:proteic killer suppression protein
MKFFWGNMIRSFKDQDTEEVWNGRYVKKWHPNIQKVALRKLMVLHRARSLQDIAVSPGFGLEKLRGDRDGQFSIRINDQFRICFDWDDTGFVENVEITDYH